MAGKSAGLSAVAEEPKEEGVTRLFIVIVGERRIMLCANPPYWLVLSGAPFPPVVQVASDQVIAPPPVVGRDG